MTKPDPRKSFWSALKASDIAKVDWANIDWKQSTEGLREQFESASHAMEPDLPHMAEISNLIIDGGGGPINARYYVPLGAGIGPAPGIVFFHGGGFVLGDVASYDTLCRRLAAAARCRVVSVDYRLAPEHKFPSAHDDASAAWHWVVANAAMLSLDTERLAVAGDSAGGNLSAYICQDMKRTKGPLPAFQLLLYPLVQFADIRAKKLSLQEGGFFISPSLFEYYRDSYIADPGDRMDRRVSPLFAPDEDFRGLPPAHILLCGWDPLKHEGQAYADKLAAQGVSVTVKTYSDMVHGFMNMTGVLGKARRAIADAGDLVGRELGAR